MELMLEIQNLMAVRIEVLINVIHRETTTTVKHLYVFKKIGSFTGNNNCKASDYVTGHILAMDS